jgi:hypothetical protein
VLDGWIHARLLTHQNGVCLMDFAISAMAIETMLVRPIPHP